MSKLEEIEKNGIDTELSNGYDDVEWLINRVKKLEAALKEACYRHHTNCDNDCVHICPVKIMRKALQE